MAKFKREVLDKMRTDPDLFIALVKELNIKPASLPVIIARNDRSINQYSIVTLVASHLGKEPAELLEEEVEPVNK